MKGTEFEELAKGPGRAIALGKSAERMSAHHNIVSYRKVQKAFEQAQNCFVRDPG